MGLIDQTAGVAKDAAYFSFWWKVVWTLGAVTLLNVGLGALQAWLLFKILRRLE